MNIKKHAWFVWTCSRGVFKFTPRSRFGLGSLQKMKLRTLQASVIVTTLGHTGRRVISDFYEELVRLERICTPRFFSGYTSDSFTEQREWLRTSGGIDEMSSAEVRVRGELFRPTLAHLQELRIDQALRMDWSGKLYETMCRLCPAERLLYCGLCHGRDIKNKRNWSNEAGFLDDRHLVSHNFVASSMILLLYID